MEFLWFFAWIYSVIKKIFGKFLFWSFWANSGPEWVQNEVFLFLWKISAQNFLIFYIKLQQYKDLKLRQIIFWGKILHWGFWAKNYLNFLTFIGNQWIKLFWFFAWSCKSIKAENWIRLLWQKSYLGDFEA